MSNSNIFLLLQFSMLSFFFFCDTSSSPVASTLTTSTLLSTSSSTNNNNVVIPPTTSPFKTPEAEAEAVTGGVRDHHHIDPIIVITLISTLSALLTSLIVFMAACFSKFLTFKLRRKSGKQQAVGDHHDHQEEMQNSKSSDAVHDVAKRYTWNEIQRLTMNFSQVVGSGGFSMVYLARLPTNSVSNLGLGAVKIHCSGGERLHGLFRQELDILLRLQHENIVKFFGYCDDREQGALVFEYVPNRSLQEKLHGDGGEAESVLPWRRRMAIAFQLAQAIEYLHEKCDLQIVHGDIKASNILLDNQLNCKLCDFGSAKMGFSSMVMPSSSPLSSPCLNSSRNKHLTVIGSPGYTDPYHFRTGIASKKSDVYSYGVIILELVMGMEAFSPERGQLLTSIAGPMLKDIAECETSKVIEMVDPRLGGDIDLEEARVMLHISALCLRQSPTLRPSASRILQLMEEGIPSISFLSSSPHHTKINK